MRFDETAIFKQGKKRKMMGGFILNKRNVPGEDEKVKEFAGEHGTPVVAVIPRSDDITFCEDKGMTVVEGARDSEAAQRFIDLAKMLLEG